MYDLVIVGSGPAGLSAAVYAKRACLDLLVLEKEMMAGGQIVYTEEVDNYLGFPGTSGFDLAQQFENNWNQVKALRQKVSFLQVELCTASSEYRGKRSWPGQGYLIVQPATGLFSRIKWLRSLVAEM